MAISFFKDLKNSFLLKIIGVGITFGTQILVTQIIGISNYGVWNTAFSWMQIIFITSLAGNTSALLREASSSREGILNKFIKICIQVLLTYVFAYTIFYASLKLTGYIDSHELKLALAITFFLGIMRMFTKLETSLIQAVQKNYLSVLNVGIILPFFKALTVIILFYNFGNSILILSSYPIAEAAIVLIFLYFVFRNYNLGEWSGTFEISFNVHFWLNDLTKKLLPFVNIAIISFILSSEDIGGYSAAFKIGEFLMFFTTIFISFSPVIVSYIKENRWEDLQVAYLAINKVLLVVVFPFFLFLLVFSKEILSIFGQSFSDYSIVLQILVIGVYVDAVTGPIGEMLNMSENEALEKNINIFATVLNVILLFVLSTNYGVIGAAISFSLSRVVANSSKLFFTNKKLNIKTLSSSHIKILLLQTSLITPFLFFSNIGYRIVLFLLMMILLIIVTKVMKWISVEEIKTIKNI